MEFIEGTDGLWRAVTEVKPEVQPWKSKNLVRFGKLRLLRTAFRDSKIIAQACFKQFRRVAMRSKQKRPNGCQEMILQHDCRHQTLPFQSSIATFFPTAVFAALNIIRLSFLLFFIQHFWFSLL
uniref:Uncharacterized protein n=1 Tax=Ascaris lumbricoides TaxID=6252 RepID=A0A0M3I406_ASCLU